VTASTVDDRLKTPMSIARRTTSNAGSRFTALDGSLPCRVELRQYAPCVVAEVILNATPEAAGNWHCGDADTTETSPCAS
jgi:hypothetical protein